MFNTTYLMNRISAAKVLIGTIPSRIVLSKGEAEELIKDIDWPRQATVIAIEDMGFRQGEALIGTWNTVDVFMKIEPKIVRCYHLNAKIEGGESLGKCYCFDCSEYILIKDAFNGWGDWLRENVFNKKQCDCRKFHVTNTEPIILVCDDCGKTFEWNKWMFNKGKA